MFEFDQERALLRRRRNSGTMQESFGRKWIFYDTFFFPDMFLIFHDMLNWIEQTSEKIQKTWTLQSLRSFDPLDLLRLGPVMCHCFYEGPMGPGICCAGLLICFCFVFVLFF